MTLPELSAKIAGGIAGKVKPLLDDKQDKLAVTGAANKGVYVSAAGVVSPVTHELNASVPANFAPAAAAPLMDGAASVGTSVKYAREDHRHPSDTSRASADDVEAIKTLLQSAVLYRTASGNPATFDDGAAANVRDLTVTLTPTQSGSGDPSPTNIRPISGVSSVTLTRTGKNLLDFSGISSGTAIDASYSANGDSLIYRHKVAGYAHGNAKTVDLSAYAGQNVTASVENIVEGADNANPDYTGFVRIRGRAEPNASSNEYQYDLYVGGPNGLSKTVAVTESAKFMIFGFHFRNASAVGDVSAFVRPQVELGEARTAYEPYQGQSVAVPLVDSNDNPLTVYGGTLDVTAGTLTVTWANIASYNGETLPGVWMSDRDAYASGTTPTTGAQVVYELAAPVAYTLTPQPLATLHGYNAVSADAGSVAVEYRADVALSLDALESNLTNALLSLGAGF